MPPDVSVPINTVKALLAAATEKGCDTNAVLDSLGINAEEIENSRVFSALTYGKLYQRIMLVMRDEWFGMLSGDRIRPGSFRMLCLSVIHCKTLEQAIIRAGEFCEICRGFQIKYTCERTSKRALVRLDKPDMVTQESFDTLLRETPPATFYTSVAMSHRFNCWLIGRDIPLAAAYFSFPKPESFEALAPMDVRNIEFDQPFNGISFDPKFLDYPIVQNEERMEEFIRTAPYHLVVEDPAAQSMTDKVKALLSRNVGREMFSADQAATRLRVSVTTLRRRLQSEGSTFQKLKDNCRMEAAFHYLGCSDFPISDIAALLGFDDSSAFFRAFKRWTGITPGEYRKQQGRS